MPLIIKMPLSALHYDSKSFCIMFCIDIDPDRINHTLATKYIIVEVLLTATIVHASNIGSSMVDPN